MLDLRPRQRSRTGRQVHQVTVEGEGKDEMALAGRGEQGGDILLNTEGVRGGASRRKQAGRRR